MKPATPIQKGRRKDINLILSSAARGLEAEAERLCNLPLPNAQ